MEHPLLEVRNLTQYFPLRSGFLLKTTGYVKAVDGVSFSLEKTKTLGIVGESGCGKSTLARSISQLYKPTLGDVLYNGHNLTKLSQKDMLKIRKKMQIIFQDPYASLDPRMTVGRIIRQPLKIHKIGSPQQQKDKVVELLENVGLKSSHLNRYPHEFSGGQRQRIGIARAIALEPELIICDEPVSALDVSIQAQILNLLKDLQQKLNLTYIFISHDLSVVKYMCDDLAVMYLGKIVEMSKSSDIYENPKHPYTQALLKAIPKLGEGKVKNRELLTGDVPSPIHPPSGCHFHPRCQFAMNSCKINRPDLKDINKGNNHKASCWLYTNI